MARVRGKDTAPERLVRGALHARGHRFRLHASDLPGRPDIVFRGDRLAVFVHGCFWHRHPGCPHCRMPKSRLDFWMPKFEANVARDEIAAKRLSEAGWRVETIWECEARDPSKREAFVEHITELRAGGGHRPSLQKARDRDERAP
jgi:DNA mismatch endonuclease (patch repair protein)